MRRALLLSLLLLACRDKKPRAVQELEELQKKKAAQAKAQKEKEEALTPLPTDVAHLDPPYDTASSTLLIADAPCPTDLWALFPGDVPGETPEEKKANQARRPALEKELRSKQFLVKLRAPTEVELKPYDAPKGEFALEVLGSISCTDAIGRITFAWTPAKAGDPHGAGADEVSMNAWLAPKVALTIPIKTMAEAKEFEKANRFALSGRVVFHAGKVEVDKKLKRVAKVTEEAAGEKLGYGGGTEDWGAGRLVRADLIGLRLARDREREQVMELKTLPVAK